MHGTGASRCIGSCFFFISSTWIQGPTRSCSLRGGSKASRMMRNPEFWQLKANVAVHPSVDMHRTASKVAEAMDQNGHGCWSKLHQLPKAACCADIGCFLFSAPARYSSGPPCTDDNLGLHISTSPTTSTFAAERTQTTQHSGSGQFGRGDNVCFVVGPDRLRPCGSTDNVLPCLV